MSRTWHGHVTPALLIAVLALLAAVGGTALADQATTAKKDKLTKQEKKKVKKLADKRISKAEPTLSVSSAKTATTATSASDADTVDSHDATCPGGTILIRGNCFDQVPRAADDVYGASDTCRAAGGLLPTPLLLLSTRDVLDLGALADERLTDGFYTADNIKVVTVALDNGTLKPIPDTEERKFHCVFPLVR
ncbi:MAG: hypothetical protein ACR2N5_04500 [Solirubrobacterales bacterium]